MKKMVFKTQEAGDRKLGRMPKDARFNPFDGSPLLELRGIAGTSRRESQLEAFKKRKVDKEKLVSDIVRDWTGGTKRQNHSLAKAMVLPKEEREQVIEKSVEEVRKTAGERIATVLNRLFALSMMGESIVSIDYLPVDELNWEHAKEPGRDHFPVPLELRSRVLERGEKEFLFAQGIETGKGGMCTLTNIMLEGEIRMGQFGTLRVGNPDSSAGSHGPYYVVVDVGFGEKNVQYRDGGRNCRITEDAHIAYIVPLEEHKANVTNAIAQGFRLGLVSWHEAVILISKLATYEEFVSAPKGIYRNARAFSELNKETAKEILFDAVDSQEREEYNKLISR